MTIGNLSHVYQSPSEQDVDRVMDKLIQTLGSPPEGILIRKESKIQEFCVVVDANAKNTEALCYLASCHEELENLQSGLKRSSTVPIQSGDRSQNLELSFWEKGKQFLRDLL